MTERTYGNNINNIITEYQLEPNNCPSQVFNIKKDKNNELDSTDPQYNKVAKL